MNLPPMDQPPLQAIATDAYLAAMAAIPSPSIANATPSYASAPVHPPYAEMIMAAIQTLNEKDGSSKKAIAKFIEGAYPNLPPSHPALLTHHLKRLKNSGQLAMVKKSYIIPPPPGTRSDLPTPPPPSADFSATKRRPGRPPKLKDATFDPLPPPPAGISFPPPSSGFDDAGAVVSVKRRGRPPKTKPSPATASLDYPVQHQQVPVVYAAEPLGSHNPDLLNSGLVNGTTAPTPKRRGRPPKQSAPSSAVDQVPEDSAAPALVKRKAGRPPKLAGRPRGRPRKTDPFYAPPVLQAPAAAAAGGSRRGRPRKRPLLAVGAPNLAAVGMKRRGRPRKLGRPVGRPRKNASTVYAHPSGESEVAASVELTRKLEYMQLKVKSAVGLLKPHLINANIIDILTAIQDLEELATMDITASTTTEIATAPMVEVEPIAPTMAHATAPPTEMAAPVLDLSAPAYGEPGVMGHLPMAFN